ncbi:MAG TPA: hypothetical protein VMT00_13360 [Thermoanaerobaculia bacterium]|nr:hypothetical protein [Thermoanaerobaculia bacterium]
MRYIVATRSKLDSLSDVHYPLPLLLAVNTLVLLGLDRIGAIPDWIKSAATLFLAF